MYRRRARRRGIVLLIILSLLAIFAMIGVAFIVAAGQYRRGARSAARLHVFRDEPQQILDRGMYAALRDLPNSDTASPMRGHSLLRDFYGTDGAKGIVTAAAFEAPVSGGQFIGMTVTSGAPALKDQSHYYNGAVLTMLDGPYRGRSSRIVEHMLSFDMSGNVNGRLLRVEAFDSDGSTLAVPLPGNSFIINGREYNGTGVGYDPTSRNLDQVINLAGTNAETALLPNFAAEGYTTSGVNPDLGGSDESWDAVDFQNMFLAMVPSTATSSTDIFPSFHRPDLVNFWCQRIRVSKLSALTPAEQDTVLERPYGPDGIRNNADESNAPWSNVPLADRDFIASIKRHIILRPLSEQHPSFNGSNPGFFATSTSQRWDVDNDGDGIFDSIWIDAGLPVIQRADGRRYKPLFAFLIRDLDGRININAADCLNRNANYPNQMSDARVAGYSGTAMSFPRGLGIGPADVNMKDLFLNQEHVNVMNGRYGSDQLPGVSGDDLLSQIKSLGLPNDYNAGPYAYGSPPDLKGQGIVALDHVGQPIFGFMGNTGEATDDPYEMNPTGEGSADTPFTLFDLERALRFTDKDSAKLSQRLLQVAPTTMADATRRALFTTSSSHIPVPNVQWNSTERNNANYLSGADPLNPTVVDLFRTKLRKNGITQEDVINAELEKMVPFEILHGRPFDLNRWFGNGLDDNGNGVVDESIEQLGVAPAVPPNPAEQVFGVKYNHLNDTPGHDARHLYARQLYCLMMLCIDSSYKWRLPNGNQSPTPNILARHVAQWVANVVDFRDRDGVMTPFEFDVNPFNGWQVDGDPRNRGTDQVDNDGDGSIDEADEQEPERFVVWGTEYPDLLLTENIAFHDRRVKDTQHDDKQQNRLENGDFADQDLDQYRKPEGSLFLELYCPRNFATNNASFPLELYDSQGNLDLGRMAPPRLFAGQNQATRHPVWRAVISNPPAAQVLEVASRADQTEAFIEPVTADRVVWFAPSDTTGAPENSRAFFGRTGALAAQNNVGQQRASNLTLAPNHYAVVGPRNDTRIGSLRGGGDGNPATLDPSPHQMIYLDPPNQILSFTVTGGAYTGNYPATVGNMNATIQTPLTVICAAKPPATWTNQNTSIGVNVSEPLPQALNYYSEPLQTNERYADLTMAMDPTSNVCPDEPYDGRAGMPLEGKTNTGTYQNYRSVYLQRLADPLRPWNPEPNDPVFGAQYDPTLFINPYITIDWSTIDLTVFSGEENTDQQLTDKNNQMEWIDPTDEDPYNAAPPENFASRERGPNNGLLWVPDTTAPPATPNDTPDTDHYFNRAMRMSLGYLNSTYGSPQANYPGVMPVSPLPPGYVGSPSYPFPWLTWNNRPFANTLELMFVPYCAPSRLCLEYTPLPNSSPYDNQRQTFGHLFNFFQVTSGGAEESPHFYRILDLVDTPALFVGSERWYNPNVFVNDAAAIRFRPPYNVFSRFHDSGRVNINTIFDEAVWRSVAWGYLSSDPNATALATAQWNTIRTSRQGIGAGNLNDYPTMFANPFRAGISGDIMPNVQNMRRRGVEATLLRGDGTAINTAQPLLVASSTARHDRTDRNPYFRYRAMNRLSNLLTTHSNVFAVWVTVGFFEVEPNTPTGVDSTHPDGYRLGQELGIDTGEIQRHRGFYIIDRSIPVAFEPGTNHNVDRAIVVRRFIE